MPTKPKAAKPKPREATVDVLKTICTNLMDGELHTANVLRALARDNYEQPSMQRLHGVLHRERAARGLVKSKAHKVKSLRGPHLTNNIQMVLETANQCGGWARFLQVVETINSVKQCRP